MRLENEANREQGVRHSARMRIPGQLVVPDYPAIRFPFGVPLILATVRESKMSPFGPASGREG